MDKLIKENTIQTYSNVYSKSIFEQKRQFKVNFELSVRLIKRIMSRICAILFLIVNLNVNLLAQLETHILNLDSTTTFQEISNPEQVFLNDLEQTLDSATFYSGGGEFKNFKRFQHFWEPRLYSDKSFETYSLAQQAFYTTTYQNYVNASTEIWKELGPTNTPVGNGPVEFITFFDNGTSASTQYMLTGAVQSGLFYSQDNGETWSPAGTDTQWESSGCSWAVFHPTNHQSWCASSSGNSNSGASSFMGRTGGVYFTSNEGQTWIKKADYLDFGQWTIIRKLIWDPSNVNRLYVATSNGLYKTDNLYNSNPTWSKILNYNIYDLEIKPDNSNTIYATCSETQTNGIVEWTVQTSTNNGTNWQQLFVSNNTPLTIEVSKAKPNYLYMCELLVGNTASLSYYYNNNWNSINNSSSMNFGGGHTFGVEQVQDGETIMIAYDTDLKSITLGGSISSTKTVNHDDVEDVVYHPYNNNEIWICTHGGPEKSTDGGNSWIAKYNGVATAMTEKMATSYTNPEYVMLGLYHDGTQITRSTYTNNWKPEWQMVSWGDGQQPLIDSKDPKHMWSSLQKYYGLRYSNNYFISGTQWISNIAYFYTQAVLNKENSNYLYVNSISSGKENVKRFSTRGATSGDIISDFSSFLDPSITEILTIGMVTPYNSNDELIVWVDARGGTSGNGFHVFRTRNSTSANPSWVELSIPRSGWITDIEFDPYNTDIVYLCYSNSTDENRWPLADSMIYKIDYTNASNPTFIDLTKNLPFSHSGHYCLEYERGSDGVLYLVTDFGVFTTNNQLQTPNNANNAWQILGTGLPHVAANGIEINYPMNLLRVGTYGRGAWEIPLPCTFESSKIEIDQNTTWTTVERLPKGVVVKTGNTLTINNNAVISFPSGTGIVIEPGAKLTIDNATVKNACDGLWQGILVQGDQNYDQTDETRQGVLEMSNDATIQNAEVAVFVGEQFVNNGSAAVQNNFGGGIIKIDDANFLNNQKDIVMLPYELWSTVTQKPIPQVSYIQRSSFQSDANMLLDPVLQKGKMGGIYAYGVKGLKIQGNVFENQDNSLATFDRGTAITAINSSIDVSHFCDPAITPCTNVKNQFNNLYYGVVVTNGISSNDLVEINENEFTNTYRAIYLSGTNNAQVLLNDIEAADQAIVQAGQPSPGAPYGIYINGGKGFRVEENTLWRPSSNGPEIFNGARGIIVHKTGAVNNEIYKNTLTNLFLSEQAQCYNSGTDITANSSEAETGLKFFCNNSQTSTSSYDFWIGGLSTCTQGTSVVGVPRFGIAKFQKQSLINPQSGLPTPAPAGNQFSSDHASLPATSALDFDNGQGGWLKYWWDDLDATGRWEPVKNDNVYTELMDVTFEACPSKINIGGGTSLTTLYQNLHSAQVELNSSLVVLNIWKDGGNANLDEEVETTLPWDIYQQFNSLLAESPYLSEGVLQEVIDNPAFTSLMVKLLFIANPHSIHSEVLMQALENRLPPMPQSYIDEIKSQPETSSQLEELESDVSADNHLVSMLSEDIKHSYRSDTLHAWAMDSLIAFMSRKPGLYDKYELALIYLYLGQYEGMQNVLSDIETGFELHEELETDYNDFVSIVSIAQNMQENNLYEQGLSDTQRDDLEIILSNDRPMNAPMALALLLRNNPAYEFSETVYDVSESSPRMAQPQNEHSTEYLNQEFALYPNPANDFTTLNYNCQFVDLNYAIYDLQGRKLVNIKLATIEDLNTNEVLIDLSKLSQGTYQFIIYTGTTQLWNTKFIVTE